MSYEPSLPCRCHSGKPYAKCCRIYHLGKECPGPEALMRSRYTAYVLNMPQYIIDTTHPDNPSYMEDKVAWAEEIEKFTKGTRFVGLQVYDVDQDEKQGSVTFLAQLRQAGQDASFSERSLFLKVKEQWLYLSGTIIER